MSIDTIDDHKCAFRRLGVHVLDSDEDRSRYSRDTAYSHARLTPAVLMPDNKQQVLAIVNYANQQGLNLLCSGGRTGLTGGASVVAQEWVLSTQRLKRIQAVDVLNNHVDVESGVSLQEVKHHVAKNGLFFPVAMASQGSASIGGAIACNAGGHNVLQYGMIRNWVKSLTVVTGGAQLLTLNKNLAKNNLGLDLMQLFIGSEGSLGVIVDAQLHLAQTEEKGQTFLVACDVFAQLMSLLTALRQSAPLYSFEIFSAACLQLHEEKSTDKHLQVKGARWYVIVESHKYYDECLIDIFDTLLKHKQLLSVVVAHTQAQRRDIWAARENLSTYLQTKHLCKYDLSLAIERWPDFLAEMECKLASLPIDNAIHPYVFGHLGDGNLHLNLLLDQLGPMTKQLLDDMIYELILAYEGSISAEHGIGFIKKAYLKKARSSQELILMRQFKQLLDPNAVLNPNKILDIDMA